MMIAIALFVLLLSKINCLQVSPNPQFPGILQAPLFQRQKSSLPSQPPTAFRFDNAPLPNIQAHQEFSGPSEFPPASQIGPKEVLTNLRSRLSHSQSTSNLPANFEEPKGNYKEMVGFKPHTSFIPQTGSLLGANSIPYRSEAGMPNVQASTGFTSQPLPQVQPTFPSELESSPYTNMHELLLKNSLASSKETQAFRSINSLGLQNSQFMPIKQHSPLDPTLTGQSTFDPFLSSLGASIPSPLIPSSPSKPPRSIIPSPLTLIDSISSTYLCDDQINSFDKSEQILTSTVGCLELTVTPYGTISETPLPDPSIPLPRSPFLPIASPVSALAPPFSPLLPPAKPNAKSNNFLNKVPVPPPFI